MPEAGLEPLAAALQEVLGEPVIRIAATGGGGNNRIYRAELAGGPVAIKLYHETADRSHLRRLTRETDSLRWLRARGTAAVPTVHARSERHGLAVFDWVSGARLPTPLPSGERGATIKAVQGFLAALHAAASQPPAHTWLAQEACLSAAELVRQIDHRRLHLRALRGAEPELVEFIENAFEPVFARAQTRLDAAYRDLGLAGDRDIPESARTFSPSDFGYHNALRVDGGLVFIDFEYAGWDDPVKLTADFLWHPAMRLSRAERIAFWQTTCGLFAGALAFDIRFAAQYPLYGLRWCLILLNEFLPERWQKRVFAAGGRLQESDWRAAKLRQLERAQGYLRMASRIVDTPARARFDNEFVLS